MDSTLLKTKSGVQKEEYIHFSRSSEILSIPTGMFSGLSCRQRDIGKFLHYQNAKRSKLGRGQDSEISTHCEAFTSGPSCIFHRCCW